MTQQNLNQKEKKPEALKAPGTGSPSNLGKDSKSTPELKDGHFG